MYKYTADDREIIATARRANKDKRAEKRLHALELRASEISAARPNVVVQPCETICGLTEHVISSITCRNWIQDCCV